MIFNMTRRTFSKVGCAAAVAAATLAAPAVAKELFILAHAMTSDHIFSALSDRFLETLGEDSNFKIAYHPGGDLGDWTSLFEQSMQGVVPMTLA